MRASRLRATLHAMIVLIVGNVISQLLMTTLPGIST